MKPYAYAKARTNKAFNASATKKLPPGNSENAKKIPTDSRNAGLTGIMPNTHADRGVTSRTSPVD